MRTLAPLLLAAAGCITFDGSGDDGSGFTDAGPPPPDAAPPRCELAATDLAVCEGVDPCPVVEALRADCEDSLRSMHLALGDAAAFVLARVGSEPLAAPQLFSITGGAIEELDARHQSLADRVVAAGGVPLVITKAGPQSPLVDSTGATVADPAGQLFDAAAGDDGRVHVVYSTGEGALALATRDAAGTWTSAPLADSGYKASLAMAGDQPYAVHTRHEEDAVRYQLPGQESVAITPEGARVSFAAAFAAGAETPVAVTDNRHFSHSHDLEGSVWVSGGSTFARGTFSGLTESCTNQCGSSCAGLCVESGEQIEGEAAEVVATADGRSWVVYIAARVDRQVRLEEDDNIVFGCHCDHEDPVERGGELSLVLGTVEPPAGEGEAPALVERWRGPLPEAGRARMAVAARDDRIAVAISVEGSATGHLFTIDPAGL